MMTEFHTHPTYTNYESDKEGNIRSKITGKILSPSPNHDGYVTFSLTKEYGNKTVRVHRIVAECWLENPDDKPTVNHINKDRKDNRVCNLEWSTYVEQSTHKNTVGEPSQKFYTKIIRIDKDGNEHVYENYRHAVTKILECQDKKITEISINSIGSRLCNVIKNNRMYMGYYWKYVPIVDLPNEIWKLALIDGNKSHYVSNMGRIKYNDKLCSGKAAATGYVSVSINHKPRALHRVVALTFIPNDDQTKNQVNHIDGIKHNNAVSNLEWVSGTQNVIHAVGLNPEIKQIIQYKGNDILHQFRSHNHASKVTTLAGTTIKKLCENGNHPDEELHYKYYDTTTDNLETMKTTGSNIEPVKIIDPLANVQLIQYKDNNIIKTFSSHNQVFQDLGIHHDAIIFCCTTGNPSLKGYYIKYYDVSTDNLITMKTTKSHSKPIEIVKYNAKTINVYKDKELINTITSITKVCEIYTISKSILEKAIRDYGKYEFNGMTFIPNNEQTIRSKSIYVYENNKLIKTFNAIKFAAKEYGIGRKFLSKMCKQGDYSIKKLTSTFTFTLTPPVDLIDKVEVPKPVEVHKLDPIKIIKPVKPVKDVKPIIPTTPIELHEPNEPPKLVKPIMSTIIQYKSDDILGIFQSATHAYRETGIANVTITKYCDEGNPSKNDVYFKYYDPTTDDLVTKKTTYVDTKLVENIQYNARKINVFKDGVLINTVNSLMEAVRLYNVTNKVLGGRIHRTGQCEFDGMIFKPEVPVDLTKVIPYPKVLERKYPDHVKPVFVYSKDSIFIKKFPTIASAAKEYEIDSRTMSRYCNLGDYHAKDMIFRLKEYDDQIKQPKPPEQPKLEPILSPKIVKPVELIKLTQNIKSVNVFDKEDQLIKSFPTISAAAKEYDIERRHLGTMINKGNYEAKGVIFKLA